jgi:hypothetical protein
MKRTGDNFLSLPRHSMCIMSRVNEGLGGGSWSPLFLCLVAAGFLFNTFLVKIYKKY